MMPSPATHSEPTFEAGAVLEHVSDAVAVVDQDWRCLYFNAAFERMVGQDRRQMLGKSCWELASAAVGTRFEDQFRKAMAQQVPLECAAFYPRLNIWVEARAFPSPHTLTIFFRDITGQKHAEEALAASEERFRSLFDKMSEGFALCEIICDEHGKPMDFRYLQVNAAFERQSGLKPDQVTGKRVLEVIPDLEPYWLELYGKVALTGEPARFENHSAGLDRHFAVFAFSPVKGQFAILFADINERVKAQEEMRRAKEELEVASRAKDHFLAVLSHELRTPLTPVLTTAQIMEADSTLSPEHQEAMGMIRRNVELEARLIDDLLDITRITRGKLELHFTTVDLHERLRQVLAMCEGDIAAKQLKLRVEMQAGRGHVSADPARLQQILWNLLKNAVKFTPVGGSITVRTHNTDDDHMVVSVQDTGVGIEPEVLPRLFNAFEQDGKIVTRQFGGLGLGLTISKGLVDLHGGTLIAQSEGQGKGATFTLTLRTAADITSQWPRFGGTEALRALATARRILLVEDHPDTAKAMSSVLKRYGFAVSLAYSVAEAVKLAQSSPFDLLISDIGLPDGSGLDVMQQMAAIKPMKAIAISGFGMEEDIRKSKEAGFLAHLIKPVNLTTLERVLVEVLGASPVEPDRPLEPGHSSQG